MKKIFEDFAKKIKTKEELIFYLEEIAQIRQIIFKDKDIPLSKKVERKVDGEFRKFLEISEKEEVISKNPGQQSSFFQELEKYLQSLPEIKLEIAFSPDDNSLDRISQWFEKELGQKIILDLIINPRVVGGAIIDYRGNWRDFSLAKKIDQLISQKNQ
ncbi:MAG: F0F1 ATP synthase subunit delta [Candidatus Nealsonbacteria bacterium]|nr:F0F1 ATP synthase subunit delta [Candidatus Nealsonbacteria bacterium]